MSTPQVANILKTKATLWVAPLGTALPDPDLASEEDWPAPWFRVGYTGAPLKESIEDDRMEVDVEEILSSIDQFIIKEKASLETELAEIAAEYIQLAKGGSITIVPPGATTVGYEELLIGNQARTVKYVVGWEGQRWDEDDNQLPVRVFHPRATFKLNGAQELSQKTDTYTKLPIIIRALGNASVNDGAHTLWRRVTAPATG